MTPPAETVSIPVERLKRSTRAEARAIHSVLGKPARGPQKEENGKGPNSCSNATGRERG